MKGIFKPMRYFSQIFDGKEQEMQIGFPTDVKHVAHIGWDGPSVTPPTWMNEYKSAPLGTFGSESVGDGSEPKASSHSHDLSLLGAIEPQGNEQAHGPSPVPKPSRRKQSITESPLPDGEGGEMKVPKPSRRHASSGSLVVDASSPNHAHSSAPRHSRRNKSTECALGDANVSDLTEGSTRRGRRTPRVKDPSSNDPELPAIPKQTKKKKKSKAGSSDGSSVKHKVVEVVTEPTERCSDLNIDESIKVSEPV